MLKTALLLLVIALLSSLGWSQSNDPMSAVRPVTTGPALRASTGERQGYLVAVFNQTGGGVSFYYDNFIPEIEFGYIIRRHWRREVRDGQSVMVISRLMAIDRTQNRVWILCPDGVIHDCRRRG